MIFGGILAGGIGSRMSQTGLPKQFLSLGGVPILVRTVRRFCEFGRFDRIIVTMTESHMEYARELLKKHGIGMGKIELVLGGASRFESLLCLCRAAAASAAGEEEVLMLTHDCARPFVSQRILADNLAGMEEFDMVTTSVPTVDTVLISEDGRVGTRVPDRHTIFCDQGPQTLRVRHFLRLVGSLSEEEHAKYIEAGRLYMEKGFRVGIVPGDRMNFKMTTPLDMTVAEALLRENPSL